MKTARTEPGSAGNHARIATLTVNPTIDVNTRVEEVLPDRKLRCEQPVREPGGGGINVSRSLRKLGASSRTLYLGGGPTGDVLEHLLNAEGLTQQRIPIEAWTREVLIVYEEKSGSQYRFGMPGPEVREDEWPRCLKVLSGLDPAPDYVVASGSLAPGMPDDFYVQVCRAVAEMGNARVIVDTSGEALRSLSGAKAFLLKPNIREIREIVGENLDDEEDQKDAARHLVEEGYAEVIVLSLDGGGVFVATVDGVEHVAAPSVEVRSRVGAGDSNVAGIVLGLSRGWHLMDAVRFGVAAASSAVMTEGTELCRRDDTERLYEEMAGSGTSASTR